MVSDQQTEELAINYKKLLIFWSTYMTYAMSVGVQSKLRVRSFTASVCLSLGLVACGGGSGVTGGGSMAMPARKA